MRPNWVLMLEYVLLAALVAGATTGLFWWLFRHPAATALGFIISMPVVAKLLAKPLIELGHEGFTWLSRQPLREWQGGYYSFEGQHVRVYDHEGELWLVASDVLAATGIRELSRAMLATSSKGVRKIPGTRHTGLDVEAVRKLLDGRREPDVGRFILWFEREVVRPWERKRGAPFGEAARL